jgi:Holliday junction DNA helicase RuvA
VLDLQGKVAAPLNGGQPALDLSAGADDDLIPALRDALSALTALGYSDGQVKKVRKVLVDMPDSSTQEYLQAGLKALL